MFAIFTAQAFVLHSGPASLAVSNAKTPVKYDKRCYKHRNRIEIMFGRLKDWRRVATRYDRCPTAFLSAIALAATVIFWV
ncbi:MAG: transposase [Pseudophaeobacter arcticus]|jgi:transposase